MRLIKAIVVFILVMAFTPAARGADREVNLLAMGDWGNDGPAQKAVAAAMARFVKAESQRTFDGMLLAGDNFYVQLAGVNDPKWKTLFEDLYDPAILKFPFYVAVGNHDYEKHPQSGLVKWQVELAYAKANPTSRWKAPDRWYRVSFPQAEPLVTVLMLDSNRPLMGDQLWAEQIAWIKSELAQPRTGKWLIAVAHHPFFSNGDHGDIGPLRAEWGRMFEQAGVDLFIAGHDHDLQHLQVPGWKQSFVLVGGGGATTRPMRVDARGRGPFSKAANGFAAMRFTPDSATVQLISRDGQVLHEFTRTPDAKVKVTRTTESDPAVPRTVRSITRGGEEATTRSATRATTRTTTRATSGAPQGE